VLLYVNFPAGKCPARSSFALLTQHKLLIYCVAIINELHADHWASSAGLSFNGANSATVFAPSSYPLPFLPLLIFFARLFLPHCLSSLYTSISRRQENKPAPALIAGRTCPAYIRGCHSSAYTKITTSALRGNAIAQQDGFHCVL
jgi:hypothetical protein